MTFFSHGTPDFTFQTFKAGPAGRLCCRLGVDIHVCETWNDLTRAASRANHRGKLTEAARHASDVWSSGERAVLFAILYACDFAWLADELGAGRTFSAINITEGGFRTAIAAAIEPGSDAMDEVQYLALGALRGAIQGMVASGFPVDAVIVICREEVMALEKEGRCTSFEDDDAGPDDEVNCRLCGAVAECPPVVGPWRCPSCGYPVSGY